ncbi:MAG: hypothetical protein MSH13_07390, partial [Ruminococcus callidus]|nr:hypothetical protein [Ruminococcus callidus]
TPSACKFPVIFHKNAREYIKYSLRFLFHLTKNLTTHLSHNLCAVLPKNYVAIVDHIYNSAGFRPYTKGERYNSLTEAYAAYEKLLTDGKYSNYKDTLPK